MMLREYDLDLMHLSWILLIELIEPMYIPHKTLVSEISQSIGKKPL
jgi:hypothetical protein